MKSKIKQSRLYKGLCALRMKPSIEADKRLNVDFATQESNAKIGIAEEKGNQYQASTNGLKKVLKKLPITSADNIMDIGCGKGRAMYLMSQFPFKKITGLELSVPLCEIARLNFQKLKLNQCTIIQDDASKFTDYDAYNYFYMFNSFPELVFSQMLIHLLKSIGKNPRKVYFIYLNPVCHALLIKAGFRLVFKKRSFIKWFQYNCYVYDTKEKLKNKRQS